MTTPIGGPIGQPTPEVKSDYDFSGAKETLQTLGGKQSNVAPLILCTATVGEMATAVGRAAAGKMSSVFGRKSSA
jgi:hypothetical protein